MQTDEVYKISVEDIKNSQQAKPEIVYGSFFKRYIASVLDGVISVIVTAILGGFLGGWLGPMIVAFGLGEFFEPILTIVGYIVGFVGGIAYYVVFESAEEFRATPGKLLMGLRVTGENDECISPWRSTARFFSKYVSAVIFGIGYLMALWRPKNQALHDSMCRTYVIQYKKPILPVWIVAVLAILVILVPTVLILLSGAKNFSEARDRSNLRACFTNQKTILGALEMYNLDTNKTLIIKNADDMKILLDETYLSGMPKDPGYYKTDSYRSDENGNVWCTNHGTIEGTCIGDSPRCLEALSKIKQ